jgi:sugar/nucleoside kinase (ribokinase family)
VFAAACFVALANGSATSAAVAYANAAAAVRIEGLGPGAVGDRAAIEQRLSRA